jgi:hypothetical protein
MRKSRRCPTCPGEKPVGSLCCATCRETKLFGEIVDNLDPREISARWRVERNPNRPAVVRRADPTLTPCPKCGDFKPLFMRSEHAGWNIGHKTIPIIDSYVQCRACGWRSMSRPSKKLSALAWKQGKRGVFVKDAAPQSEPQPQD